MKQYWKQHWFEYVLSAVLVSLAAGALTVLFGYSFSTNDDAMLRSIVSGSYTGTPEAHLIYIMYPLGFIGQCLYMLLPHVPWYDIFMTVTHYLCWFLVIGRIGEQFQSKKGKLIAVFASFLAILLLDAQYVVMHQYTILAAWFAAVAILFLLTSKESKGFSFWSDRILCLVFLVLCLWLRKQVFILALPIGAIILVLEFIRDAKQLKTRAVLAGKIVFIAVFAVLTIASYGVELKAYDTPEWQEFLAYNEARTDIYDYYGIPRYTQYSTVYEELGLSYADYLAIDLYNSEVVEGLLTPQLQKLADTAKHAWKAGYGIKSVIRIMVEASVREILHNPVQPMGLFITILYLAACINTVKNNKKIDFTLILCLLLFQFLIVGYFVWRGRFPERVSYGFYLMNASFLAGMLFAGNREAEEGTEAGVETTLTKFWWIVLISVAIIFVAGMGLYKFREMKEANKTFAINSADWIAINEYFDEHSDKKFCIDTYSFVFSAEGMFKVQTENGNILRLGTWVQGSPLQKKHYQMNGINVSYVFADDTQDFYFVQMKEYSTEWLEQRWFEKGYNAEPELVDTIVVPSGRKFIVMKPRNKTE
ncbi:MAG: hypothetical protein E7288_08130 [Lachnospiraceae bacterium]|nr:hypothetical protein [Lachnospiraceae bacterium]